MRVFFSCVCVCIVSFVFFSIVFSGIAGVVFVWYCFLVLGEFVFLI